MKVRYLFPLAALTFLIAFSNASFTQAQETNAETGQPQPTPQTTANPFVYNGAKGKLGIFTYQTLNDASDIEIIDINTTEAKLVIPAQIDGHKVKKLIWKH